MSRKKLKTYQDLLDFLKEASPQQLEQKVQVVKSHPVYEYVHPLEPAICVGTIDELGILYARSSVDNQRHGDELVLFTDGNGFGEDGATSYELPSLSKWEKLKQRVYWRICFWLNARPCNGFFEKGKSHYPKNHSERADWTGPAQKIADLESAGKLPVDSTLECILENRVDKIE